MLEKTIARPSDFIRNVAQRGDALELLRSLPDGCAALGFFDPQFRELLDKQQYGNEGVSRQRKRAELPSMGSDQIDACCREFTRVLRSSGYLMRWLDDCTLVEGVHLRLKDDALKRVGLIAWDKQRPGQGWRVRYCGDYLLVLQKPPLAAKATWHDRRIRTRWSERIIHPKSQHPHIKPINLISRLIGAVTNLGDLVIDPCAGSFVVMQAAYQLGHDFIGVDLAYEESAAIGNVGGEL